MNRMLHSAKFWTMIVDLVVSLATYFFTKYAAPELSNDVLFVIGAMQPVVLAVIAAWAYEDGQEKGASRSFKIVEPSPAPAAQGERQ